MPKQTATVSLATMTLVLKDAARQNEKVLLNKIRQEDEDKPERDLLDEIRLILKTLDNKTRLLTNTGKAARITRLEETDRQISGLIETGSAGTIQNIINTETGAASYVTDLKDAFMQPLYFLFHIPKGEHKGIVFLERYRTSALQGVFLDFIKYEFKKRNPSFILDSNYLTDTETFNQLLEEARIKEIRLTENQWSEERSENVNKPKEIKGKLSVTFKPIRDSGNEYVNKVKKLWAGKLKVGNVLELKGNLIEPDEASFVISRKGLKDRRINFDGANTVFRPYIDISDEIGQPGKDGFPLFENLDKSAKKLLTEVSKGLYEPNRKS